MSGTPKTDADSTKGLQEPADKPLTTEEAAQQDISFVYGNTEIDGTVSGELSRSILTAMTNGDLPLRERLDVVLTGPMAKLGRPLPDNVPALVDLDRQLKELQQLLDARNVAEILNIATDQNLRDLADTVTRVALELAGWAQGSPPDMAQTT